MSIYQEIPQFCQQGRDTMKRHKPLQDSSSCLVNLCLQEWRCFFSTGRSCNHQRQHIGEEHQMSKQQCRQDELGTASCLFDSLCKGHQKHQLRVGSGHVYEVDCASIPGWTLKMQSAIAAFAQQIVTFQCQSCCTMPVSMPHLSACAAPSWCTLSRAKGNQLHFAQA